MIVRELAQTSDICHTFLPGSWRIRVLLASKIMSMLLELQ
jgi:hypothetical protein